MAPEAKIPNNLEIDQALKEFEASKSLKEVLPKVSEVSTLPEALNSSEIDQALEEFETKSSAEQRSEDVQTLKDSELPKMVRLVMKWSGGAVKDQKQAEYVLLGVVVLNIIITILVLKILL